MKLAALSAATRRAATDGARFAVLLVALVLIANPDVRVLLLAIDAVGLDALLILGAMQMRLGWHAFAILAASSSRWLATAPTHLSAAAVRLFGILMPAGRTTLAAREIIYDSARSRSLAPHYRLAIALCIAVGIGA